MRRVSNKEVVAITATLGTPTNMARTRALLGPDIGDALNSNIACTEIRDRLDLVIEHTARSCWAHNSMVQAALPVGENADRQAVARKVTVIAAASLWAIVEPKTHWLPVVFDLYKWIRNTDVDNRIWLKSKGLHVYVRRGSHPYNGKIVNCLDIANIAAPVQGRGNATVFIENAETIAAAFDRAVYVENVLDDRFARFFERRGYKLVDAQAVGMSSWIKLKGAIA